MADFLDPNSPYAGLINMAKPDPKAYQATQERMQKMARWNAITDALRLIAEGVGGTFGGNIPQRDSTKPTMYAMDKFLQMDDQYRQAIQNWKNVALQIGVQDQRIRGQREYQDTRLAKEQEFRRDERVAGQEFQAGLRQEGYEHEEKIRQEAQAHAAGMQEDRQRFDMSKEDIEQENALERIKAQGEAYQTRYSTTTGASKGISINGYGMIPPQQIGWATSILASKLDPYGNEAMNDKLLKSFLKNEGAMTSVEYTELLNRYWYLVEPDYQKMVQSNTPSGGQAQATQTPAGGAQQYMPKTMPGKVQPQAQAQPQARSQAQPTYTGNPEQDIAAIVQRGSDDELVSYVQKAIAPHEPGFMVWSPAKQDQWISEKVEAIKAYYKSK